MGTRPPTDVCCVVDVSGSMGIECTNGDSESQGLSVLSVVKHACKTVIHSLTPQDRFTLVKYSTNAEVRACCYYRYLINCCVSAQSSLNYHTTDCFEYDIHECCWIENGRTCH